MKKFILLLTLIVCVLIQAQAQPTMHLLPGTNKITLRGNSGGFVTNPTSYEVYRSTTPNPETIYRTFVDGSDYNWEDTNVQQGEFYYYRIKARDDNAGTVTNFSDEAVAKTITGQGNHYVFDGIDDRVTLFSSSLFGSTGSNALNSIRFWVRIDEVPTGKDMEILRVTETSTINNNNSLRIYHNANRLVVSFFRDDWWTPNNSTRTYIANTKNIADGEWHLIELNRFGQNSTAVFVDGVGYTLLSNNDPTVVGYDFAIHQMIIGGQSNASTSFFKGAIDNLQLYNGNNLRHHWKFDEFDGTTKALNSVVNNPSLNKENGVTSAETSTFGPVITVSYTDGVSVRWNKDIDLPGEVLQGYEVWRKEGDRNLQFLASVVKEDTALLDPTITPGLTYEYEVRSIKSNNVIVRSETDLAKPTTGFDRHLVVDGIGEVQIPDSDLFSDNDGTIEFWIRADNGDILPATNYSVINKHDEVGSRNGFNFVLDRTNIYVQVKGETGSPINVRPEPAVGIVDDQWHHIAFTYEWGGTSTIYIDGQERGSFTNTLDVDLSSEPFRIGKSPASFWEPFIGEIDEVYVWDKVLTATEIANQMNQRIPGDIDGLSGVWRFDLPNIAGVAYDDGVNEFDGTVVGGLENEIDERKHLAASYDGTQVFLEWDFVLNSAITSFEVSREQLDIVSSPTLLATLSASENSYIDATAQENTQYQYIIRALTDENPEFAFDNMITNTDLGNMLYFREGGGTAVLTEEVTNNQIGMIEFRFRTDVAPASGTSYTLLNRHDSQGSDNGFNFVLNENSLRVQFKVNGGDPINLTHNENLIDDEWHHVALIYNWSGFNSLVVDGNVAAVETISNLTISPEQTRVGSSANSFWAPFEGRIDELRMWSTPRSLSDINAAKDIRIADNTLDLEAVWHFDEPAGIFASDNGPNNYDAILSGDVQFWKEPGRLTFSSTTGGFRESSGNNGRIIGQMTISIEENSFANAGGVINDNQFAIENEILVATGPTVFEDLISGLDPILTVNPDGKTANLIFQGEASYHINEFSTSSLTLSFDPAVFAEDELVVNAQNAQTDISYTLLDNIAPSLDQEIPNIELVIGGTEEQIDLLNHFSDPDFEQQTQFFVSTNNSLATVVLSGSVLTMTAGNTEGATEITVDYFDNNGGEASDTFIAYVVKTEQDIIFNPIDDIDLVNQNTVTLSAIATSGLDVEFELLTGDGSITGNELTVNQTGVFEVEATQPGDETYAAAEPVVVSFNVTDSRKDDQTITFTDDLSGLTYGDDVITLSGSASSGLEISYTTQGAVEVTGNTLTIANAGEASVTAIQSGDDDYNPADPVTIIFNIEKAPLTATADDQTITFGDPLPDFTITYDGFLGGDDETDIDVLPGTETSAGLLSDAGTYAIDVGSGNDNNYAFDYVNGTLTIEKADQAITFNEIGDRDIATSNQVVLQASASSGLAVGYELQGNGRLEDGIITIEQTGTFVVTAFQLGDNNYNQATSVSQTFLVTNSNKESQTITFEAIPDQEYGDQLTLTATASSGLPVDYNLISGNATIENGVWTLRGIGEFEIQAFQDGDSEYNPAQLVSQQFTVTKATLTATAVNQTIQLGESIPSLTFNYSGFKLDEDATVLDSEPTISTTATTESSAGEYAITLAGGSDDLYEFTLVNGTLLIEALTLSVPDEVVTVYPNPVMDRLLVKGIQPETMRLLTVDGRIVRQVGSDQMDVSDLNAGSYILQLYRTDGSISTHRIIKR